MSSLRFRRGQAPHLDGFIVVGDGGDYPGGASWRWKCGVKKMW